MRILLINPPIRTNRPAYVHPMGLAMVAWALENAGHNVEILDHNVLRPDDVSATLPAVEYDLIGLSGLITTYRHHVHLMPLLREKYPKAKIVIGGGGMTSAPKVYMENLKPDFGVIGEGEYTAVELCEAIDGSQAHEDILGLTYYDGELKINPPRPLEKDLDKVSNQAFHLMDMDYYSKSVMHRQDLQRELQVIATRGCPYSCKYCYHIFGRTFRHRSVEKVVEEIHFLQSRWGVPSFTFADECITANKKYMISLCDEIIKQGIKIVWNCFSRVDTVDREMATKMKEAGCYLIGFGIESGSQVILDAMDKRTTVEKAKETIAMCREEGLMTVGTFQYGFPGENEETIDETRDFCYETFLVPRFYFTCPYPGTAIYDEFKPRILEKFGTLHNFFMELDDASKFIINLTDMDTETYFLRKFRRDRDIVIGVGIRTIADRIRMQILDYGGIFMRK